MNAPEENQHDRVINERGYRQDYYPPVPTRFTRIMRNNLVWQLIRFAIINLKMIRLVRKSHH